jgi:pimeloyl-ACP methyl ester carboxylesterase
MYRSYFENAQLALAAYAENVAPGMAPDDYRTALIRAGMASSQADDFADRYSVVHQQENDLAGFSATLFWDNQQNRYAFAIRGTEDTPDFIDADPDIFAHGIAYRQIVSLYNYIQRLITPVGQEVSQYSLREWLVPPDDRLYVEVYPGRYLSLEWGGVVTGLSPANQPTPFVSAPVDVTGHSLGGHLAIAFARLFPELCGQVHTYNSPGFEVGEPQVEQFFDLLAGRPTTFPSAEDVTNIFANESLEADEPGWNAVAGLHTLPGGEPDVQIYIESQTPPTSEPEPPSARNHSQMILTDSLALHDLVAELAPDADAVVLASALNAVSRQTHDSLETALASLRRLFMGQEDPYAKDPQTGNSEEARDAYYVAIQELRDNVLFGQTAASANAVLLSLADYTDSAQLVASARNSLAFRYALKYLEPFVLLNIHSVYAQHNGNNQLDLYDPVTGQGMTDQYLANRAGFLAEVLRVRTEDGEFPNYSQPNAAPLYYKDVATGYEIYLGEEEPGLVDRLLGHPSPAALPQIQFGSDQDDSLIQGGNKEDRLYGGGGDDKLLGGEGTDYLEGNQGDDFLVAGQFGSQDTDRDILQGGKGDDFYIAGYNDVVSDSDGFGRVIFEGETLRGGSRAAGETAYKSDGCRSVTDLILLNFLDAFGCGRDNLLRV